MFLGSLGACAHGGAVPIFFVFFGRLINAFGFNQHHPNKLGQEVGKEALSMFYLGLVVMFASWLEVACWIQTGERQSARIRVRYLQSILSQDVGYFDTSITTADVVGHVAQDISLVQDAISEKTGNFIHFMAKFIVGFAVGFSSVWQLSLTTLAVVPAIVLAGCAYAMTMTGHATKSQQAYEDAGKKAEQAITQVRTVYAYVGEASEVEAYSKELQNTLNLGKKGGLAKGLGLGFTYALCIGAWALLLWYAGKLVRQGSTNGGKAFTTILNVVVGGIALGQASPNLTAFAKGRAAAFKIFEMIKRRPLLGPSSQRGKGMQLALVVGNIELRDVGFSYPTRPDTPVFQNFNLTIQAAKSVAIVGSSGCGKSTLVSLIERFYDPTSGEVLLDGNNLKILDLKWLRRQIGLVNQEPALFATSIRENLLYGKEDATIDEIIAATTAAFAHSFINRFPHGYDTQVGERGVQLSGGERQRLAIARAMLTDPKILILDEATSALDSCSEQIVCKALDSLMVGRTTVVIAHRLSTVRNADTIAVMQHGQIVESGSHEMLMAKEEPGAYAALIHMQAPRSPPSNDSTPSMNPRGQLRDSCRSGYVHELTKTVAVEVLVTFYSPDKHFMKKEVEKYSTIFAGAAIVVLLGHTMQHYFMASMGESLTKRVREVLLQRILQNEIAFFENEENNSNVLGMRLSTDAASVRAAVGDRLSTIVQNLALIVTALAIVFALEWRVAWVMIACFPLLIGALVGENLFLKGFSGDLDKSYQRTSMIIGDAVSNIRTVAAFCAEGKVLNLYIRELRNPKRKLLWRGQVAGVGYGLSQFCMYSSYALALWYASTLVKAGRASFGNTIKMLMVLIFAAFGVAETIAMAPDFVKCSQSLLSIFQILDRKTEIDPEQSIGEQLQEVKGEIELRHVVFSYPSRNEVPIFEDFNLRVRAGSSLAIVGASGVGKSSVISLILRFYDPLSGRVLIDGKDIRRLHLRSLRKHMGLVQQEPALFATSIYENIRYGKEDATESEIIEAAKVANAHTFISALPKGYRTLVGERGAQLSAGQKQRVAIARAVLRSPAILLLDEATSSLDAQSEMVVQDALDQVMVGRTTVVIAHRLSTIQNADSIAVLQDGMVTEQGSHQDLINMPTSTYAHLVHQQNRHSSSRFEPS
uniref:Uncharacterized protein n=1 Tax=Physcomitrium patens TaxID=3218 RepID=A0A2K1J463_PHYPA|nr:hypothetical protein PHYPA_022176 [Physcomitrium patens]